MSSAGRASLREARFSSDVIDPAWSLATTAAASATVSLAGGTGPWLPAALLAAMRRGEPLHLEGTVDATQLSNAGWAQRVLASWFPDLSRVPVTAEGPAPWRAPVSGVGCFFSLGLDSFASVLTHLDRITHLIFVEGFDFGPGDAGVGLEARDHAREAAEALGRPLVEITTDVRDLTRGYLSFPTQTHGSVLATCALLLEDHVGEVIVPGSFYVGNPLDEPWGTSPLLDHRWSSSRVRISHDSPWLSRVQKAAVVGASPVALAHLRVCPRTWEGAYNCGRCEKCLRTMVALEAVGALDRCRTLPALTPEAIRPLRTDHPDDDLAWRDCLTALRSMPPPGRPDLEVAVRLALAKGRVRRDLPPRLSPAYQAATSVRRRLRLHRFVPQGRPGA